MTFIACEVVIPRFSRDNITRVFLDNIRLFYKLHFNILLIIVYILKEQIQLL